MVNVMAECCTLCTKDLRLVYISLDVKDKDPHSQMLMAHPTIYDSQHCGEERLTVSGVFSRKSYGSRQKMPLCTMDFQIKRRSNMPISKAVL